MTVAHVVDQLEKVLQLHEQPRDELRAKLLGAGISASDVDEIVDLACHAAATATDAMFGVIKRASSVKIVIPLVGTALGLTKNRVRSGEAGMFVLSAVSGEPVTHVDMREKSDG